MITWQKISGVILIIISVFSAFLFFNQEEKACCLCSSFRYHAPCLIDLETGDLIELGLYVPHKTKVAELADAQPAQETFSFVTLGAVSGYKNATLEQIEISIPSEIITDPMLCNACKKQLGGFRFRRYLLADLHSKDSKDVIPICAGSSAVLRCYEISAYEGEQGSLKVMIRGLLD